MNSKNVLSKDLKDIPMGVWLINSDFLILDFNNFVLNNYKKLSLKTDFQTIFSLAERENILDLLEKETSVKMPYAKYKNQNYNFVFVKADTSDNILVYLVNEINDTGDNENSLNNIFDNLNKISQLQINRNFKEHIISICCMLEDLNNRAVKNHFYDAQDTISNINTICFKMLKNINNLNIISLESGNKEDNEYSVVNIWNELAELFSDINALFKMNKLDFSYELPQNDDYVKCSMSHLSYAIINLISNSYLHCGKDTVVTVKGISNEDSITILVSNTIENIDKKDISQFFIPFNSTTNTGFNSMGIGLNVVKSVINEIDGTIFVNTDADKITFIIKIPVTYIKEETTMSNYNVEYLENKFSPLYIGLSDIIDPPLY